MPAFGLRIRMTAGFSRACERIVVDRVPRVHRAVR
jgi:hypothetical protein